MEETKTHGHVPGWIFLDRICQEDNIASFGERTVACGGVETETVNRKPVETRRGTH